MSHIVEGKHATYVIAPLTEPPTRDIRTTLGVRPEASLARTVGVEDRPGEFVVWVEYRLGDELVRRDAHLILKEPSVVADAVAATF